jgi:hypothetical protein
VEPFATVEDYDARHAAPLDEGLRGVASTRLADASAKVAAELELAGIDWRRRMGANDVFRATLTSVTCAMVERSLAAVLPGVKSRQQSAGPYSFTDSFANPTGDLYLLASERRDLGIGRSRLGMFHPHVGYGG